MTEEAREIAGKLLPFEADVLRTACGDDRMTGWGAAVAEAAEALWGYGLLRPNNRPTALGKAVASLLEQEKP